MDRGCIRKAEQWRIRPDEPRYITVYTLQSPLSPVVSFYLMRMMMMMSVVGPRFGDIQDVEEGVKI
jgi:hypothetical protein